MSAKCCPLVAWCLPVGTSLQLLGLALMVGGMLALGAFTAPAVFGGLPREMAAPVMATIFTRYDMALVVALVLVLIGEGLRWRSQALLVKSRLNGLRAILLVGLTGALLYSTQIINPQIEHLNRSGVHRNLQTPEGQRFEGLHKRSESFYKLEMLAALLLLLLTPFVRPVGHGEVGKASATPDCCL